RRLLIATQIGLASCSLALAVGTQLGFASVPYLYAFTALGAAFSALDGPARGALTPSLVAREQLPAAMALNQVLFQTAAIGGPALAGVVIVAFGIAGAYWIDVASFLVAIVGFGLMNDGLFIPALIFVALAEGADTISAIFRSTILLTVVPDHLRGRLVAISSIFFLGGPYLGQVESGVVAGLVSPEFS